MIYKARVLKVKGVTRHLADGRDVTLDARRIEIREQDGIFYLFRFDERENSIADTAHFSLAEAVQQAEFEYDLSWDSGSPLSGGDVQ